MAIVGFCTGGGGGGCVGGRVVTVPKRLIPRSSEETFWSSRGLQGHARLENFQNNGSEIGKKHICWDFSW